MLLFALMDAVSKYLSTRYPTPQILWLRYLFTVPLLLVVLPPRRFKESIKNRGAAQAAAASEVGWTSLAGMAGYQVVNRSRSVPSRVRVRVCRSRWAPFFDYCICCFLAKRRLTTRSTVDSVKAVEMISPWSQRSA